MGWQVVTTVGAWISSPSSSVIPRTLPFCVSTLWTRASVRISAPKNRAEASHAALTAPMPPSGYPQLAICPSPISPTE